MLPFGRAAADAEPAAEGDLGVAMAKNKNKKEQRRAEREREAQEQAEAAALAAERQKRYRIGAIALPLVGALGVGGVYAGTENTQLSALIALVVLALWVPLLLGALGGAIRPRDRTRAGSIDFGSRR
ncbi:MAG: hypothetical protein AB7S26_33980 [Sandaracinaceae bacterium]